MWSKETVLASLLAFEAFVLHVSDASIHDCWDHDKLTRMKFPTSQRKFEIVNKYF